MLHLFCDHFAAAAAAVQDRLIKYERSKEKLQKGVFLLMAFLPRSSNK
jgi:hypothetical protein